MMRLLIPFLMASVLPVLPLQAQTIKEAFYNKQDKMVSVKDSAYYIRQISMDPAGNTWQLRESYYPGGQLKRQGYLLDSSAALSFKGRVECFYPSGKLQEQRQYDAGLNEPGFSQEEEHSFFLINYYDSLGTAVVKDGDGYITYPRDEDGDFAEGAYEKGLKSGSWKGTFLRQKYRFEEKYDHGKLLGGVSIGPEGKQIPYKVVAQRPEYPGGIRKLLQFVGQNYQYPKAAVQNSVNGTVILKFVIDQEGNVVDTDVVKDLGFGTGYEAAKVVSKSRKWAPGKMRGIPVRVYYSLPIRLQMR